jgi:hypothetical protein
MNASAFLDRSLPPTDHELIAALGDAAPRWLRLVRVLVGEIGAHAEARWDGPRSGWCLPFKRAGRPLVTLTPRSAGFDALVVLGQHEADAARGLPLGEAVRDAFVDSPQLHDGRWLFLSIGSDADADDLLRLLSVKLPARLRARLEDAGHLTVLR